MVIGKESSRQVKLLLEQTKQTAVHLTPSPYRDARQAALASRTLLGELETVQRGDGREHACVAVQTGWGDVSRYVLK